MSEVDRVVHKFNHWELYDSGGVIEVPLGKIVLVAAQRPEDQLPTIWLERFLGPDGEPNNIDTVCLTLHGTGHKSIPFGSVHRGSCVCANGSLVWHVYGPKH